MDQPQQSQPQSEAQRILEILAVGASIAVTAKGLSGILDIPAKSIALALRIIKYVPRLARLRAGRGNTATAITSRANELYRAAYVGQAARRIEAAPDRRVAIAAEVRYYRAHLEASARRMVMAKRVDVFKRRIRSPLLGWYAVNDARTSSECRAASGRNFYFNRPPVIGYPGAVHPNCRCTPGPPHPRGTMVDNSDTVRTADSATRFEQRSI